MCQNHSHAEAEVLGVTARLLGPARIVKVTQPFRLNLSSGETWTLPPGTTVLVPFSPQEPSCQQTSPAMGGQFTCVFSMEEHALTFTPTTQDTPATNLSNGSYAPNPGLPGVIKDEDSDLPF